jgi:hypothetical protein
MNGKTFDGGYTNLYFDVERDSTTWATRTTYGADETLPTSSAGTWHHIQQSYDSSNYPTVTLTITIDGTAYPYTIPGNESLVAFNSAYVKPGAYSDGIAPQTQVHYDNILVTFP